ncbi:hypothetical protein WOLCODRAFT_145350 [Wolfiporia cocos MD-104 SS10]|uniref:Uncharacterized protein n=1 Tax=Wolfiporia cocos (strain MD-104) TaxID=742152 RepID=A0A2H3JUA5_WOLCO|nr:hypothetical protein WOLCODRAFT_145350 [Wolfiporia cocos MD-104 SS10]
MAFLQVPNPFMELHHMPDYNHSLTGPQYYLQNFDASDRDDRDFALFAVHNRRARRPQNLEKWPTHTLFAFVYGVVAMHAFPPGPLSECVHILRWNWGSRFYSSAVGNNRDGELSSISAQREALAERKREQDDARAARRANRIVQEVDEAAIVVAMIREIIDRDNEASTEELKRQAEQRRHEQAREKVADWLAGVQPHSR